MDGSLSRQSQQIGPNKGLSKSSSQRRQRAGIAKATSPPRPFLRARATQLDFPSKCMIPANHTLCRKRPPSAGRLAKDVPAGFVPQKSLDFTEWTKSATAGSPGPVSVPLRHRESRRSTACRCRIEAAIPRISYCRNCMHNRSSDRRPHQVLFCSWRRLPASPLCSPVSVRCKHEARGDY